MPQSWSDQAERKLLLSVLEPEGKPRWDIVGFPGEACRYVDVFADIALMVAISTPKLSSLSSSTQHNHITPIPQLFFYSIQATSTLRLLLVNMPTKWNWDTSNSMQMLMLVIAEADVKPNTAVWTRVASQLGDITPSAVRYDDGACVQYLSCSNIPHLDIELQVVAFST